MDKKIFLILLLALIFRLILINDHLHNPNFSIQQDNYVDYAQGLKRGIVNTPQFSQADTRLFPGYPILIFLLQPIFKSAITAGLTISLLSSLAAIYLFWLLTKNALTAAVFAFFPPVWVMQGTKVATEPITAFLLLGSIILYKRRWFFLIGLILGLAADIRLISIGLLGALGVHLVFTGQRRTLWPLLFGFLLIFSLLFLYNYFVFGASGIFQQFLLYPPSGRATFGGVQIIQDVFRAIDWGQYRILISGLFYLGINFFALFQLFKNQKKSPIFQISFYWMVFSLLFIFFLGPTPLLEEFSRFTVPFVPAMVLGILAPFIKTNDES